MNLQDASAAVPKLGYVPGSFPRDVVKINQFAEHVLLGQILEPLVDADRFGNMTRGIADQWKVSQDGKTIVFHIEKGQTFSNGQPIRARDVKYSIDRHLKEATQSSNFLKSIKEVRETGVVAAIDKFDEWKVQSCILYCAQPGSKTLWSYTEVMGFLIILINTENEFYRNIMMPFRNAQLEAPLAAIELFIGSLANEEHARFVTKAEAKDILESYRAYVGLHLDRYIKDNDISVSEEDLSRFSQDEA